MSKHELALVIGPAGDDAAMDRALDALEVSRKKTSREPFSTEPRETALSRGGVRLTASECAALAR